MVKTTKYGLVLLALILFSFSSFALTIDPEVLVQPSNSNITYTFSADWEFDEIAINSTHMTFDGRNLSIEGVISIWDINSITSGG